jgi:hypothetical protein
MTPERWRQITDIFHEALAQDVARRHDFVASRCAGDALLEQEVAGMLAAHGNAAGFGEVPGVIADSVGAGSSVGAAPLVAGTRLGPYEILARIGVGGMGEVYQARDNRLQRTVAIKVAKDQFSDRFEREARAVAALNHPHICTLHDIGANYVVMEYIDGIPVRGPLPVGQALEYAGQILAALQAAHEAGIVHRDLKPANILVTRHGIKLLDFGLARVGHASPIQASQTNSGLIAGRPAYMSPEQWEGKPVDIRSDHYSFGVVLYEMLTGRPADRESPALAHTWLERIVRRCLAHDPADRFQSADEIRRTLVERRPVSRAKVVASIAAGLALVAAIINFVGYGDPPAPKLTNQDVLVVADFENRPVKRSSIRRFDRHWHFS